MERQSHLVFQHLFFLCSQWEELEPVETRQRPVVDERQVTFIKSNHDELAAKEALQPEAMREPSQWAH